jgi:hypothetical protein
MPPAGSQSCLLIVSYSAICVLLAAALLNLFT